MEKVEREIICESDVGERVRKMRAFLFDHLM